MQWKYDIKLFFLDENCTRIITRTTLGQRTADTGGHLARAVILIPSGTRARVEAIFRVGYFSLP